LLAQNPAFDAAFRHFYDDRQAVARGGPLVHDMRRALAYLQVLIRAASVRPAFIDTRPRAARVVNGRPAPYANLSLTESANPFFHPTLDLAGGVVYQAAPVRLTGHYQWSSRLDGDRTAAGQYALVHFEVSLNKLSPLSGDRPRKGLPRSSRRRAHRQDHPEQRPAGGRLQRQWPRGRRDRVGRAT